jgi:multiple sugar transport system permease protein
MSVRSSAGQSPAEGRAPSDRPARRKAEPGQLLGYAMLAPPVLLVLGLLVVPAIYTGWVSLHSWSLISGDSPSFVGLKNYSAIVESSTLRDSVYRSAFFVALTVSLQFVIGLAIALLLHNVFGSLRLLRTVLLLPLMVSDVVVGLSWRLMLQYDGGLANWFLGLFHIGPVSFLGQNLSLVSVVVVDTWQNVPFVTLILYAALQSLPGDVMDASRVDGTTAWSQLRYVILPLIKPAVLVVLLFRTIFALRTFGSVWVLTQGGPGRSSTLISVDVYNLAFRDYDLGMGSAMSVALLLIGLVITLIYMRWLNREAL